MTTVGDRTLLIEPNGYLGVTEEKALSTSAGTRWVSHFVNINGLDSFLWAEDTAESDVRARAPRPSVANNP
ncbi:DUF6461 domain-containing protein [Streptomyces sp. RLB3-17]|uniref:DUF6461 domain-containing protein n=1 Tax=Streptomyces sp. RLB3-17 TaxID=2594455 RepID=UPI0021F170E8|nr:DUF6461 domain-containing protein [Streptomyces sp. RLB3-17]